MNRDTGSGQDPVTRDADPRDLRRRTLRSFSVFAGALLIALAAWLGVRSVPPGEDDLIPPAFRRVLELNGRIWHALFEVDRVMITPPPAVGKKPRLNGAIGLRAPVDLAKWSMQVLASEDAPPRQVRMAELRALPRVESTTEFRCIEGWSENISYAGVRFSDFVRAYGLGAHSGAIADPAHPPADTYRYVGFETPDGEYYVSIDIESMLHGQTVLAYEMNGRELDDPNGAPLRLVIPTKYGIKNIKRIGKIFFSDKRPPDYWAEQGYDWFAGL